MKELENATHFNQNILLAVGVALLCIVLFWLVGFLLCKKLGPALEKRINEEKHPILVLLLHGFRYPLYIFLIFTGLCIAALTMSSRNFINAPQIITDLFGYAPSIIYKLMRIASILCISWGLLASSDMAGLLLRGARQRLDLRMGNSVTRFLSGMFKVVVVALTVVILLSEMHYNINGLITGMGLGGLTVALAAKDSASNFFGGFILIIDKPFEIGDWVSCGTIEGTVEDINMRNTIIRNDSGSLTTMPNALLSTAPITNYSSAMNQRRADVTLNLVYSATHQQVKDFISSVRNVLETDPEVVSDSVVVRFSSFGESSLDVRIIYYTTLPGMAEHLRIRERINYAIMDLAEKKGITFAYPTSSVQVSGALDNTTAPAADVAENTPPEA